jgi:hypothetical protein
VSFFFRSGWFLGPSEREVIGDFEIYGNHFHSRVLWVRPRALENRLIPTLVETPHALSYGTIAW